jgi:hypothetical protein
MTSVSDSKSLMTRTQERIYTQLEEWHPHHWSDVADLLQSHLIDFPSRASLEGYVQSIHREVTWLLYKQVVQPILGYTDKLMRRKIEWEPLTSISSHRVKSIYIGCGLNINSDRLELYSILDHTWTESLPTPGQKQLIVKEQVIPSSAQGPTVYLGESYGYDAWEVFVSKTKSLSVGTDISAFLKEWVHYRLVVWAAQFIAGICEYRKPDSKMPEYLYKSMVTTPLLIEERSNVYRSKMPWPDRQLDHVKLDSMCEKIRDVLIELFPSLRPRLDSVIWRLGGVRPWEWTFSTDRMTALNAVITSHVHRLKQDHMQLGHPFVPGTWHQTGFYELNAYFNYELNTIMIPMVWMFQEAFWPRYTRVFTRDWSGLGFILAHEFAHAIDREGIKVTYPLDVNVLAADQYPVWRIRWEQYAQHRLSSHSDTEIEDVCDLIAMDVVSRIIGIALPDDLELDFQTNFIWTRAPSDEPVQDSSGAPTIHSADTLRVRQALQWRSQVLSKSGTGSSLSGLPKNKQDHEFSAPRSKHPTDRVSARTGR